MFGPDSQISPETVRTGFISCNPILLWKQLSLQLITATFVSKDCLRIYYILEKCQNRKLKEKKTNKLFFTVLIGLMTKYVAGVPGKILESIYLTYCDTMHAYLNHKYMVKVIFICLTNKKTKQKPRR